VKPAALSSADGLEAEPFRLTAVPSGVEAGALVVTAAAARPAVGKSTLALDLCRSASIHHNMTSVIFSLEMSRFEIGMRLLCGEAATDLPVRWVHISELKDPTPFLSGGELLLTTGMQLNTPQRQGEFVTRLADHQLAGVGFREVSNHRECTAETPELFSYRRDGGTGRFAGLIWLAP